LGVRGETETPLKDEESARELGIRSAFSVNLPFLWGFLLDMQVQKKAM
jgi:hypothetical protein